MLTIVGMGSASARYDEIADWYVEFTRNWATEPRAYMALMDIDDLDGALATVAAVLAPGGWFSFSVLHPCYPGGPEGSLSGLPSWPPDGGYAREGWWTTQCTGVRGRAGVNHRMLSTYLNAVLRAGLTIEELAERGTSVPVTLIARCRQPARASASRVPGRPRIPGASHA